MATQLILLDADQSDWKLDDHTREIGRRGLAQARAALAEAVQRSVARKEAA